MGFLEAFENILERAYEVEDRDLGERGGFLGRLAPGIWLVGETSLLFQLPEREEACGVLEFLVLDELADQLPARIIILRIFLGRLLGAGQQGAGL